MTTEEETGQDGRGGRILEWEGPSPVLPIPTINYASFFLNNISQYGDDIALVSSSSSSGFVVIFTEIYIFHTVVNYSRVIKFTQLLRCSQICNSLIQFTVVIEYAFLSF